MENILTNQLLDDLAHHYGVDSDYALAKKLGYTPQRVSKWRRGDRIGRDNVSEFCDVLYPEDLTKKAEMLVRWMRESEKNDQMLPLWDRLQKLASSAAIACVMLGASLAPTHVEASPTAHFSNSHLPIIYIMRNYMNCGVG